MPLVHHASTTMAGSSAPLPRSSATLLCRSTSRAPLLLSWLLGDSTPLLCSVSLCTFLKLLEFRIIGSPGSWATRLLCWAWPYKSATPMPSIHEELQRPSTPLPALLYHAPLRRYQRSSTTPLYAATSAPLPRPSTPLPALLYHAPLRRYQRSSTTPLYAATSAPLPRPSTPLPALLYHAPLRRYQRSYTTPLYAATSAPIPRPSTPLPALLYHAPLRRYQRSSTTPLYAATSAPIPRPSTPLPALLYHAPLRRYQRSSTTPLYAAGAHGQLMEHSMEHVMEHTDAQLMEHTDAREHLGLGRRPGGHGQRPVDAMGTCKPTRVHTLKGHEHLDAHACAYVSTCRL
jgi:hypothetical protein